MISFTNDQLMELQGILLDEYSREKLNVEAEEALCETIGEGVSTKCYSRLHRLKSIWGAVNFDLNSRSSETYRSQ